MAGQRTKGWSTSHGAALLALVLTVTAAWSGATGENTRFTAPSQPAASHQPTAQRTMPPEVLARLSRVLHAFFGPLSNEDRVALLEPLRDLAWQWAPDETATELLMLLYGTALHVQALAQPQLTLDDLLQHVQPDVDRLLAEGAPEAAMVLLRAAWWVRYPQVDPTVWFDRVALPWLAQAREGADTAQRAQGAERLTALLESLYGVPHLVPHLHRFSDRVEAELGAASLPALALARPLAVHDRRKGRLDEAWARLERAYRLAQDSLPADHPMRAMLQSERSIVLYRQGRVMEAIREHERLPAFWRAQTPQAWLRGGRAHNNLTSFYMALGDYRQAQIEAERSEAHARDGGSYTVWGESQPARVSGLLARHHQGEPGALGRAMTLIEAETPRGDFNEVNLEQILVLAERQGDTALAARAATVLRHLIQRLMTPLQSDRVMLHLLRAREQPDTLAARAPHHWRALAIGAMGRSAAHEAQALFEAGRLWRASRPAMATAFYKLGTAALSRLRRDLPADAADLHRMGLVLYEPHLRDLVRLLIDQGRLIESEQALAFLHEAEQTELTQGLRRRELPASGLALHAQEAAWRDLLSEWGQRLRGISTALDARLEQHQGDPDREHLAAPEADTALDQAVAAFEQLAQQQASETRRALARVSKMPARPPIPPRTGRIRYLVQADGIDLLVQTAGQAAQHERIAWPRAELAATVLAWRRALEGAEPAQLPLSQALHRRILAPALRRLARQQPGLRHLEIVADGVLRHVPFAALHDGQRYLVERVSLSQLNPAAAVHTPQHRTARQPSIGKAARPVKGGTVGLGYSGAAAGAAGSAGVSAASPLPAVPRELAALQQATGGRLWQDREFNIESLHAALQQRPALVHLASHFKLDAGGPGASHLLLGDGSRLSLRDLIALPWQGVDLAVLSACETALTLEADALPAAGQGRELLGLGVALQAAGVRQVLATHWRISDSATGDWMQFLYQQLPAHLSTGQALTPQWLATAQRLWLRRHRDDAQSHPHYWAAFTWMQ